MCVCVRVCVRVRVRVGSERALRYLLKTVDVSLNAQNFKLMSL